MSEEPDVNKEAKEAAASIIKAVKDPTAQNVVDAISETADVPRAGIKAGWTWQQILYVSCAAILIALAGSGATQLATRRSEPAPIPAPKADDSEVVKALNDGFARVEKVQLSGSLATLAAIDKLGEKIDAKPVPVNPDDPTPKVKSLTLPESIDVQVKSDVFAKIKASAPTPVSWFYKLVPGFNVEQHGDTLFVSATMPGTYYVYAYTSGNGKLTDAAACRVTANVAPMPPPAPKPDPTPDPSPKPVPKVDFLNVVVVYESSDVNSKTARVVADYVFWESLKPLGVSYFKLDKDQKDAVGNLLVDKQGYRQHMDKQGIPTILYMDRTGLVLQANPLPDSTAAVRSVITQYLGK